MNWPSHGGMCKRASDAVPQSGMVLNNNLRVKVVFINYRWSQLSVKPVQMCFWFLCFIYRYTVCAAKNYKLPKKKKKTVQYVHSSMYFYTYNGLCKCSECVRSRKNIYILTLMWAILWLWTVPDQLQNCSSIEFLLYSKTGNAPERQWPQALIG